jgi:glycerol-3-phosphate dehydrogenase
MKRDLDALASGQFDLLVVGGGIYGACIARDAALRGLHVALIEQSDFSSATSHNSGKIVHGGIRYLQHLNLRRVRESVSELGIWLTIAPHLVCPMKFVIPTQGHLMRGPAALFAGILAHKLIATGTQRHVTAALKTSMGRVYSKAALHDMIPGLPGEDLTGAASWYDGQLVDADRVVLECVEAAVENGAIAANHVSAEAILRANGKVSGVGAIDQLTGNELEIRAKTTVVSGGPWAGSFLAKSIGGDASALAPPLAKNMNIVVPKMLSGFGVGLPSQRKSDAVMGSESRLYFFAPWKDVTIIGTTHFPYDGDPDEYEPTEDELQSFLDELNAAYPPAALSHEKVHYVYAGLTPADPESVRGEVGRSKRAEIIDHALAGNADGLITAIGVKYTTARLVAERVVDLVQKKLGRSGRSLEARSALLPGARGFSQSDACWANNDPSDDMIADFLRPYGSRRPDQLPSAGSPFPVVFESCARHAARNEMAMTLDDLLLRRFDLVERGLMTDDLLDIACSVLATEHGWSDVGAQKKKMEFRDRVRYLPRPEGGSDLTEHAS